MAGFGAHPELLHVIINRPYLPERLPQHCLPSLVLQWARRGRKKPVRSVFVMLERGFWILGSFLGRSLEEGFGLADEGWNRLRIVLCRPEVRAANQLQV